MDEYLVDPELRAFLKRIEHEYVVGDSLEDIYYQLNTRFAEGGWMTFGETLVVGADRKYVRIVIRFDPEVAAPK
jgi:hypothetical protein